MAFAADLSEAFRRGGLGDRFTDDASSVSLASTNGGRKGGDGRLALSLANGARRGGDGRLPLSFPNDGFRCGIRGDRGKTDSSSPKKDVFCDACFLKTRESSESRGFSTSTNGDNFRSGTFNLSDSDVPLESKDSLVPGHCAGAS